jgi:hypothetical protein
MEFRASLNGSVPKFTCADGSTAPVIRRRRVVRWDGPARKQRRIGAIAAVRIETVFDDVGVGET